LMTTKGRGVGHAAMSSPPNDEFAVREIDVPEVP
jgi:hypothetical protein